MQEGITKIFQGKGVRHKVVGVPGTGAGCAPIA